jgi:hypothetical protein
MASAGIGHHYPIIVPVAVSSGVMDGDHRRGRSDRHVVRDVGRHERRDTTKPGAATSFAVALTVSGWVRCFDTGHLAFKQLRTYGRVRAINSNPITADGRPNFRLAREQKQSFTGNTRDGMNCPFRGWVYDLPRGVWRLPGQPDGWMTAP